MTPATGFMQRAIELSQIHMESGHGGPFGAVVVFDGKIIGEGWNCVTSHKDPTAHAEVEAIRKACAHLDSFDLAGCEIYTSCEPCPMCLAAIYWARISKIFYANTKSDAAAIDFNDAFIYQEIAKNPLHRSIPMVQLMRTEANKVFFLWQQKPDRQPY
ncbi:MAG: tRNA-specific adenosine deaminase [Bdellovibrio sp. CG10_big_fil_rev_8_21_14_0_10_47_8]|nr:MAG: tRNA-specific adenosine deaminase [Bdellovibrio sp. CG10_big_fil_rev_8_21_14_0_10_47_8]